MFSIDGIIIKSIELFSRTILARFGYTATREDSSIDGSGRDLDILLDIPEETKGKFIDSILKGNHCSFKGGNTKNVLLCAQPKSASLYFTQVVAKSLCYKNHAIGFNKAGGGVYYPRLLSAKFLSENTISHCHNVPDPLTIKLIENLNLKVIVLTRNLPDAIISRADMLVKDKWCSNITSTKGMKKFLNGSKEDQIDIIIDLFAPSYINFFSGWQKYKNSDSGIKPIFIDYEEIHGNTLNAIKKVACGLNEEVDDDYIRQIITEIRGINFNKGIVGRGKKIMTKRHFEKIKNLANIMGCEDKEFLGF